MHRKPPRELTDGTGPEKVTQQLVSGFEENLGSDFKLRRERSGYHYFSRTSGIHVLLDEVRPPREEWAIVPRVLSIALTNACDLECPFCYAPKHRARLSRETVLDIASEFDAAGGQEIVLGGGEPTLYPGFIDLVQRIYLRTSLAVGFTTHGHHLTEDRLALLAPYISRIRISIDALEPRYSQIRGKPLNDLVDLVKCSAHRDQLAFNIVVLPNRVSDAADVIELAVGSGIREVLLIPVHDHGQCLLEQGDIEEVSRLITQNQERLRIRVSTNFGQALDVGTLNTSEESEILFAHVSADGYLRRNSYEEGGIALRHPKTLVEACSKLYSS